MNKEKSNYGVTNTCVAVSILISAMSGCSTYQYRRVEAPDSATVRFVNKSNSPVYLRESHRGDCTDSWPFNDDGSGIPPNTSRSTSVLPGTFFVIMPTGKVSAQHSGTPGVTLLSSCAVPVGFAAEANGLYEIAYIDEEKGCALKARWQKDGVWQSLLTTKMRPKNRFTNPVSCEKAED